MPCPDPSPFAAFALGDARRRLALRAAGDDFFAVEVSYWLPVG